MSIDKTDIWATVVSSVVELSQKQPWSHLLGLSGTDASGLPELDVLPQAGAGLQGV
jgi:hypothetical protein